jgi:MFS superfamily sulfate permease-like transporter
VGFNFSQIKGDFQGGIGAGILNFFQSIPLGLIAFHALGREYQNFGIMACIIGSVFAGFIGSLLGGSFGQIITPVPAICVVFSSVIVHLMEYQFFSPTSAEYIPHVLSLAFFTIILCGLFQFLFGIFKIDYLIKFISYPVLAGITTGAGILIIYHAIFNLIGISQDEPLNDIRIKYGNFFIGITTALLLRFRPIFLQGSFGFPAVIAFGAGLYYFLQLLGFTNESLGGTFGKFTFTLPTIETLTSTLQLALDQNVKAYFYILSPIALNLAILCSLTSLISALALKNYTNKSPNSRQELIAEGIGNMISGCFAGLPCSIGYNRSILNIEEGGTTKLSGIICSLTTLVMAFYFIDYIVYLPASVITGVVLWLGFSSIDAWSTHLFYNIFTRKVSLSKDLFVDIAIMIIVIALIFTGNFILAISIGVLISILFFLGKMRDLLIKRIYEDKSIPSKKIINEQMIDFLSQHHQEIKVIELAGIIYFGSAEKLSEEVENLLKTGVKYIILDMKKVDEIDLTGARVLEMVYQNLHKQGNELGISYLNRGSHIWQFLENMGFFEKFNKAHVFPDTDHALQYFEGLLLGNFGTRSEDIEVELSKTPVFQELNEEEFAIIRDSLEKETYKEGQIIFKEGEPADAIFFIVKGSVDVMITVGDQQTSHTKRLQSLSIGSFFGEIALFQKGIRTATVMVSSDLICYKLSYDKFQTLMKGYSHLSVTLLIGISKILSKRILFTNQIIAAMD